MQFHKIAQPTCVGFLQTLSACQWILASRQYQG
jgi:hypothetical protein